jgi:RluA family pseudouridine synthase
MNPEATVGVGSKIVVYFGEPVAEQPIVVAYRDSWLAVLDKPAGVASQAERGDAAHALDAYARRLLGPDARLMHRLDKEASGLVLFAVSPEARAPLHAALTAGRVDRRYLAIVAGVLDGSGKIALRIARHPHDARRRVALPENAPGGEAAASHFRALACANGMTATELTLETGRTHQLRVHLAALGHPIVGDRAYGGPPCERLLLHAHRLTLPHPDDSHTVAVQSPLPQLFTTCLPGLTTPSG